MPLKNHQEPVYRAEFRSPRLWASLWF